MLSIWRFTCVLAAGFSIGLTQAAGLPAARVTDTVSSPEGFAGDIMGPGAATVLIEGKPAVRIGDQALCAQVVSGVIDYISQPIITGSATVLIDGLPAARMTDTTQGGCSIITGSPSVIIGN